MISVLKVIVKPGKCRGEYEGGIDQNALNITS